MTPLARTTSAVALLWGYVLPTLAQNKEATKIFFVTWDSAHWIHVPSHFSDENRTECSQPPRYPLDDVWASVGEVIDGKLTICGGFRTVAEPYHNEDLKDCFSLDPKTNQWVEFPPLGQPRSYAASIITDEGWWITGGSEENSTSSEIFSSATRSWKKGPDLPTKRWNHCLVKINETTAFMAGGKDDNGSLSDAWLYSFPEDIWIEMPKMLTARHHMTCEVWRNEDGHSTVLVVEGEPDDQLVESFDLNTLTWSKLKNLPSKAWFSKFIKDGEDLILVNPYLSNLMSFSGTEFDIVPGQSAGLNTTDDGSLKYTTIVAVSDSQLHGCH